MFRTQKVTWKLPQTKILNFVPIWENFFEKLLLKGWCFLNEFLVPLWLWFLFGKMTFSKDLVSFPRLLVLLSLEGVMQNLLRFFWNLLCCHFSLCLTLLRGEYSSNYLVFYIAFYFSFEACRILIVPPWLFFHIFIGNDRKDCLMRL